MAKVSGFMSLLDCFQSISMRHISKNLEYFNKVFVMLLGLEFVENIFVEVFRLLKYARLKCIENRPLVAEIQ